MKDESGKCSQCDCNPCCCNKNKHCGCKLALAFGITNGLFVLVIGLLGTFYSCCLNKIEFLSHLYSDLAPTLKGSFLGAFWAFVFAFFFVKIASLIYKLLCKCCNKCCATKSCCSTGASCDTKK